MADELRITERPQLERPVLIAAFRGWNDSGESAKPRRRANGCALASISAL